MVKLQKLMSLVLCIVLVMSVVHVDGALADGFGGLWVDTAYEGESCFVGWNYYQGEFDHYEYSVNDLTGGSGAAISRVSTTGTSFSIPGSMIIGGHQYRVWVGVCDADGNVLAQAQKEFPARTRPVEQTLSISISDAYEGQSVSISWSTVSGADHYDYTILDETSGSYVSSRSSTNRTYTSIGGSSIFGGHRYKVWVGAIDEDGKAFCQSTEYFSALACKHKNVGRNETRRTSKSLNESKHRVTVTYDEICLNCGELLNSGLTETYDESHSLDSNGDCKLCDYRYSCPHTETKTVLKGTSATPLGDGIHHRITEIYSLVCANPSCGKVLVELDSSLNQSYEEEHQFSGKTCTVCGYVKADSLSVSVSYNQSSAAVSETIGATAQVSGGSGAYSFYWRVFCNGSMVNDMTNGDASYTVTASQAGQWTFTVTVTDRTTGEQASATSGAVTVAASACSHGSVSSRVVSVSYEQMSDSKHNIVTTYQQYCDWCGAKIGGEYIDKVSESHHFVGHVCEECQAVEYVYETEESVSGSFGSSGYTMTAGKSLTVTVSTSVTNGELAQVTINGRSVSMSSPASTEIAGGTSWSGQLTIDGTSAPFNTPGTYEVQLWVRTKSGYFASVDTATIVVEAPKTEESGETGKTEETEETEESVSGSFGSSGYTMTAGKSLTVTVSVNTKKGELERVTINGRSVSMSSPASTEIAGGKSWSGQLTIDGTSAPFNTPGTYEVQLWVRTKSGYFASVATATIVVKASNTEETEETGKTEETVSGSFGSASYTMTAGKSLTVTVSVNTKKGELERATINGRSVSMSSPASTEIAGGNSWRGQMTIDGASAPFNTPGTYEVQLWVRTKSGYFASVATATIVVKASDTEETEESVSGSFGSESYTMTAGKPLTMKVTAVAKGGELERVTINGRNVSMSSPASTEIAGGNSWRGQMTIDGTSAPFNTPGTYEVQLWVRTKSGYFASVDTATIVVEASKTEETVSGSFDSASYTMTVGKPLTVTVSANTKDGELERATINGRNVSMSSPASTEIAGGKSWSGQLTIDGTSAPFNTPGTYEVQLWVRTKSGYFASVDTATIVVEAPKNGLYANIVISCDAPNGCTVGKDVIASIKAYGGSGSYRYSWYSYDEGAGDYGGYLGDRETATFSSQNGEGSCHFEVTVRDKKNSKLSISLKSASFEIKHGTTTGYDDEHPHDQITYCPDHPDHVTNRQPSNYKSDNCCVCVGHAFDKKNPSKHNDGKWYVTCTRCGAEEETTVVCPVYGNTHKGTNVRYDKLNPEHTAAGHSPWIECACGNTKWGYWSSDEKKFRQKDDCEQCNSKEHEHTYVNGVCTECGEECQHIFDSAYIDDNFEYHYFCSICQARTPEQVEKDKDNLQKYLIKIQNEIDAMKTDKAREYAVSLTDPASILLASIQDENELWYKQLGAYGYKLASFQWVDVVERAFIPGNDEVKNLRKQAIQSAVMGALNTSNANKINTEENFIQKVFEDIMLQVYLDAAEKIDVAEQAEGIGSYFDAAVANKGGVSFEMIKEYFKYENPIPLTKELPKLGDILDNENKIKNTVNTFLDELNPIEEVPVRNGNGLKGGWETQKKAKAGAVLAALNFAVSSGIDIYNYSQWNEEQQALYVGSIEQAARNKEFLEELKETFPYDNVISDYCDSLITEIESKVENNLISTIEAAADKAGDLLYILTENAVEAGGDYVVPAALAAIWGNAAGGAVTAVGSLAGLGAEVVAGTDSKIDNMENIDVLFTNIQSAVEEYNKIKDREDISDEVKRFQELNILNMKIQCLEMVENLDSGWIKGDWDDIKENAIQIKESYIKQRNTLMRIDDSASDDQSGGHGGSSRKF